MKNILGQFSIEIEIALTAPLTPREARDAYCEEREERERLDNASEWDWESFVK